MASPYEGMYAKLKFPPFVFQEYPKVVTGPNGALKHVHSRSEELENAALCNKKPTEQVTLDVSNERDELAVQLAESQQRERSLADKLHELMGEVAKIKQGQEDAHRASQQGGNGNPTPAATTGPAASPAPKPTLSPTFTPPGAQKPLQPGEPGAAVPGKDKPVVAAADGSAPLSSGGQVAGK